MSSLLAKLFNPVTTFLQQNRRSRRAVPVIIVLVTVLLLLIFKLLQHEPPVKAKEEKSWTVQTTRLLDGPKTPQLALFGRVESPYTSTITASVTADVASLAIREGDRVSKDDALLVLDDSEVRLIVEQRLSDVAELEALLDSEKNRHKNDLASLKLEKSLVALAEKKLSREAKTSKSNLTSQSSFDSQKQALQNQKLALKARQLSVTDHPSRLAQLEARLKQKRAQAEQAEKDLRRTTVSAPFDGIILKTYVAPGERVRPGESLVELYSTENVELRAQLPQKYVDTIKQALANGIALTGYIDNDSEKLPVSLSRVSGEITDSNTGVDALFQVNAQDTEKLTIGEVLDILIDLPELDDVYLVPVSSIYGTDRVYRVVDGRLQKVNVQKVGVRVRQDRQFILIRSDGLHAGDEVITTQLPHAISGLKVDVRNGSTEPAL